MKSAFAQACKFVLMCEPSNDCVKRWPMKFHEGSYDCPAHVPSVHLQAPHTNSL